MGLSTWKKAPYGKIIKSDASIAKNYLQEKEINGALVGGASLKLESFCAIINSALEP